MDAVELEVSRYNTLAFIEQRPTTIRLIPVKRVRTAGSGYKDVDQDARQPQTFRIIEQGLINSASAPVIRTTDGTQREVEFLLLGAHDALMAVGDHWTEDDGREWSIGEVVRSNEYEQRALVTERGK
jgi:hypothetical protein